MLDATKVATEWEIFTNTAASDEPSLPFTTMDPHQLMTAIIETSSLADVFPNLLNWP